MLTDRKLSANSFSKKNVKSLEDRPQLSPDNLKAAFDKAVEEVASDAINGVIDDLDSSSGASYVGTADNSDVQSELNKRVSSDSIKGIRLNDTQGIEITADNTNWLNPSSNGHVIFNNAGNECYQRPKMQFVNCEVEDDGIDTTIISGLQGDKGDRGAQGIQGIQGIQGVDGKAFIPAVDTSGNISWSLATPSTIPTERNIRGPQGIQGIQGTPGPAGIAGDRGAQGERGPAGEAGAKGDTGATGAKGDKGDPAVVNGKSGASITLTAADVGAVPVDASGNATVIGNLRLKGAGNFGNKLNFGDGEYVCISEPSDDNLEIKCKTLDFKISVGTTRNGNPILDNLLATHTKSGTVHTLSVIGTLPSSGCICLSFKAVSDFSLGDTFKIGSVVYTAKPIGESLALPNKAFVNGDTVSVVVNIGDKKINFKQGGGGGGSGSGGYNVGDVIPSSCLEVEKEQTQYALEWETPAAYDASNPIACDRQGNIFVYDSSNIYKYNLKGIKVVQLALAGDSKKLCVDKDGFVFVASGGTLYKYSNSLELIRSVLYDGGASIIRCICVNDNYVHMGGDCTDMSVCRYSRDLTLFAYKTYEETGSTNPYIITSDDSNYVYMITSRGVKKLTFPSINPIWDAFISYGLNSLSINPQGQTVTSGSYNVYILSPVDGSIVKQLDESIELSGAAITIDRKGNYILKNYSIINLYTSDLVKLSSITSQASGYLAVDNELNITNGIPMMSVKLVQYRAPTTGYKVTSL